MDSDSAPSTPLPFVSPSAPAEPAQRMRSGWLLGIVIGILAGLLAFPPVRYTLAAQLRLAFEDHIPWLRSLENGRDAREVARLDRAAAFAPNDYLLQVGRATAFADPDELRESISAFNPPERRNGDRTLVRLDIVARTFDTPGAYAHLARYMMVDRVRILTSRREEKSRVEPAPAGMNASHTTRTAPVSAPASVRARDLRWMKWALHAGEAEDPDNAFWPAMLAVTYFATERDTEALRELDRAAHKPIWNAYLHEEVLGQWKLYSAAYGDNGATQKIAPLSLIAFPYLRELRAASERARDIAEEAAQRGDTRAALRIRHNIARLGLTLRDSAQWAYEALYGTDLFFIANTDSEAVSRRTFLGGETWQTQATEYIALLNRLRLQSEMNWITHEMQGCNDLRQRVDLARSDASFPGIPPGIPLAPLFGDWMAGICLLQQILACAVAGAVAAFWQNHDAARLPFAARLRRAAFPFLTVVTCLLILLVAFGAPSLSTATLALVSSTLLLIASMERLATSAKRRQAKREEQQRADPAAPGREKAEPSSEVWVTTPSSLQRSEDLWGTEAIAWLLLILLLPGLILLYAMRPALSGWHPVAQMLTTIVGTTRAPYPGDEIGLALLAFALPLAFALLGGLWAAQRRVRPWPGALLAVRRTALPAIAVLSIAYLLLLSQTLRLDAIASRALNEATHNDRQWVLTHSDPDND